MFFMQEKDGIRDYKVTGVQTCALPILKVYGMAGLRAGYVVGSTEASRELEAIAPPLGVNALTQGGIQHALKLGDKSGRASGREKGGRHARTKERTVDTVHTRAKNISTT